MLDSLDKIIDFAIQKEQDAADLYTRLANDIGPKNMKQVFEEFALEEMGHKAKLELIKQGKLEFSPPAEKILNLKIGDDLRESPADDDLNYQKALIMAMKAEKAAFRLYSDLAAMTENNEIKQAFLSLAQEEARHKLRFEIEYDDNILVEN
jgi:rubrerythrin